MSILKVLEENFDAFFFVCGQVFMDFCVHTYGYMFANVLEHTCIGYFSSIHLCCLGSKPGLSYRYFFSTEITVFYMGSEH